MLVEPRYNGPPDSGNGGWSAGLIAEELAADCARVTLHAPPPLGVRLGSQSVGDGVQYHAPDGTLIATAQSVTMDDPPVPPVSWTDAVAAAERYAGLLAHPFPTCFVCGPDRAPGDGLRLFAGRCPDGRTAAPWTVPTQPAPAGHVTIDAPGAPAEPALGCPVPMVWAALDCPGGWSVGIEARPYVLGRITAVVLALPHPGQRCVVVGVTDRHEGRKASVRTTLYGPDGSVLAMARSVWIALP